MPLLQDESSCKALHTACFAWKLTCRKNTFSYEWFGTKTMLLATFPRLCAILVPVSLDLLLVCLLLLGFFLQPGVFNNCWQKASGQGSTISAAFDETIQLGLWKWTWRVRTSRGWNMKKHAVTKMKIVWNWRSSAIIRSSNLNYFIYTSHHFTPQWYELNKWQ